MNLDDTFEASFLGIRFLVEGTSITGGPKDVLHEYPNSNRQTIEFLGQRRRNYTIRAIITGNDYTTRRNALLSALDAGQKGVLQHPFYGELQNIVCRTYSLVEDFSALGEAVFNINFGVDDGEATPELVGASLSSIENKRSGFAGFITDNFGDNFFVDSTLLGVFESATDKVNNFADDFREATKFISDPAGELSTAISELSVAATRIISEPQKLADSVRNLFDTANGLAQSTKIVYEAMEDLFDFGDDDVQLLDIETASTIQIEMNNAYFNSAVQTQALAWSYSILARVVEANLNETITESDLLLETFEEIEEAQRQIEEQFAKNIQQPVLDTESRDALYELRSETTDYIELRQIEARRVTDVRTVQMPLRVLAHQYYGNTEEYSLISRINDIPDVSFYKGQIQVVTE